MSAEELSTGSTVASGAVAGTSPTSQGQAEAEGAAASERPSLLGWLGWIGFLVMLVYVVFVGGGYAGIEVGVLRMSSLALISIGFLVWLVLAWRQPRWRPRSAIWPALLVPYVALLLTTLISPHPRLGLDYLAWGLLLLALYLLLVRILAVPFTQRRIGGVAVILAIVVDTIYLAIVAGRWLEWWDLLGYLTPPMLRPGYPGLLVGGPTVVASLSVLLGAVAFTGLGIGTGGRRLVLAVVGVLTLATVLVTGGRASWLALAVALAVVGIGLVIVQRRRIGSLIAEPRVRRLLGGALIVTVLVAVVMTPALIDRLGTSGDGGRSYYFTTAQRMFEASLLVGQGPGNWTAQRIAFTEPGEPDIYVPHAHNVYIQTLAETGLVGAVAGVIALAAILWLVIWALRGGDAVRWRWAVGAGFILIYLGIYSFLDSYINLPVMMLLAAMPIAYLDATSREALGDRWWPPGSSARRRLAAIGGGLLLAGCLVALTGLFRIESIASDHREAVRAIAEGDWQAAADPARAAAEADAAMVPYQVTLGLTAAQAGDWSAAEAAFEAAASVDDLPESWLNLALARYEMGREPDQVLEAIERGQRIAEGSPFVLVASAYLHDRLGLTGEADEAYTQLLASTPSLAADPAWRSDPAVAGRFDGLLEAAIDLTGDWELALMAGDDERARDLAEASGGALAANVIGAWTGDEAALSRLQEDAAADPTSPTMVEWAARASARAGDGEGADRFRRIIGFGLEGSGEPGYEARVLPPSHEAPPGALPLGHGYGKNDYRRPTPGQLLAPGLPSLVLVDLADEGTASGAEPGLDAE